MTNTRQFVEFMEEIASENDLVANLAPDLETRRRHTLGARRVRKLLERFALKSDQFKLEKTIACGQRIARQKGLIARIERLGADSKSARELLAVLEQTQSLFEQRRRHLIESRAARPRSGVQAQRS